MMSSIRAKEGSSVVVHEFSTIAEHDVFQHAYYACSQAAPLSKKAVRKIGSFLCGKERPSGQERTLGIAQATRQLAAKEVFRATRAELPSAVSVAQYLEILGGIVRVM